MRKLLDLWWKRVALRKGFSMEFISITNRKYHTGQDILIDPIRFSILSSKLREDTP